MNNLKLITVGVVAVVVTSVALVALPKTNEHSDVFLLRSDFSHADLKEKYDEWKNQYLPKQPTLLGDSESSETYRLQTFKNNLEKISNHNQKFMNGEHSFTMKLNQFSHLTAEEFEELHLSDLSNDEETPKNYLSVSNSGTFEEPTDLKSNVTIPLWKRIIDLYIDAFKYLFAQSYENNRPLSVDWRPKMTKPIEQGACGACYTFASTSAIQAILGIQERLSQQELVDCDSRNKGCKGGIPQKVYSYVAYQGLTYDSKYPYKMRQRDGCGINYEDSQNRVKISTYYDVQNNPESLETALKYAPVTAAIDAKSLQMYGSGIYDFPCSTKRSDSNHAVTIVGYTSEYFLIRNSWGPSWGEEGYFKVRKESTSHGTCGLYNDMSYPYVN